MLMVLLWLIVPIAIIFGISSSVKRNNLEAKHKQDIIRREQAMKLEERDSRSSLRPCPQCGEDIKKVAKLCRFCGSEIEPLAEVKAVEATVEPFKKLEKADEISEMSPEQKRKIARTYAIPGVMEKKVQGVTKYRFGKEIYDDRATADQKRDEAIANVLKE